MHYQHVDRKHHFYYICDIITTTTTTATTTTATATATATTTTTATAATATTTTTRSINSRRGSRASAFRAGSARYTRLRFARLPRVLFSAGSACVVAFNFFQEIDILQRILPLLLLTIYNLINFTISIISTTSAILLLLLLRLLLLLLQEVVTVRAGSARLRFAPFPRVSRVCVLRGFRACCFARVPRV